MILLRINWPNFALFKE